MRLSAILSTFEPASFDPKAVRRRELVRTGLAAFAMLVMLVLVGALVLGEGLGGNLLYEH